MKKFVSLNKRSKKAQKAYHSLKRGTWNINPITRVTPSNKIYKRSNVKLDSTEEW